MRSILSRKCRMASLAMVTVGVTFSSFCSAGDVKHNAIAGNLRRARRGQRS